MKFIFFLAFLIMFSTYISASVTVNESTFKEKAELSARIYVAQVIGIVKNIDSHDEIYQYLQLKVVDDILGDSKGIIVNVVSNDGFPASKLEIECIGGIYLFFLKDYMSFQGINYQESFLQPFNTKFSVHIVEDGKISNLVDGKSLTLSETKRLIRVLRSDKKNK
jgi:hypothetical protein